MGRSGRIEAIIWDPTALSTRRVYRNLVLAILLGLILLGISALATSKPWGVSSGFPFTYSYPNPLTCGALNPQNGCGYSYDLVFVALDFLFWLTIAFLGVAAIDAGSRLRSPGNTGSGKNGTMRIRALAD